MPIQVQMNFYQFYPCNRDDSDMFENGIVFYVFYPCNRDVSEIDSTLPAYL